MNSNGFEIGNGKTEDYVGGIMEQTHFALEELTQEIIAEVAPLIEEHYEEIAHYKDIKLAPDWDKYLLMQKNGTLKWFMARQDKEIVGYAVFFVSNNMHYKDSFQAVQDVLFVHPSKRGIGGQLIKWCDDMLRDMGVEAVYHHMKKNQNFAPLLERMGYELVDLVYGRRL